MPISPFPPHPPLPVPVPFFLSPTFHSPLIPSSLFLFPHLFSSFLSSPCLLPFHLNSVFYPLPRLLQTPPRLIFSFLTVLSLVLPLPPLHPIPFPLLYLFPSPPFPFYSSPALHPSSHILNPPPPFRSTHYPSNRVPILTSHLFPSPPFPALSSLPASFLLLSLPHRLLLSRFFFLLSFPIALRLLFFFLNGISISLFSPAPSPALVSFSLLLLVVHHPFPHLHFLHHSNVFPPFRLHSLHLALPRYSPHLFLQFFSTLLLFVVFLTVVLPPPLPLHSPTLSFLFTPLLPPLPLLPPRGYNPLGA